MDGIGNTAKKILYISYDGLTDPLGQSQILPYLEQLSKFGFQFTILSFEKKNRFARERDIVKNIIDRAGIQWVPLWFTARPPVLAKIYDRYKLWNKAVKLFRKEKFDLVHCRSYVAAETGLRLKRRFQTKMIFDMRGFWADEKVDNGQWDQRSFLYRKIYRHYKRKEKSFLLNADAIVSLTQAAKNYLLKIPEYHKIFIEVIPCCADLEHFDYHKTSPDERENLKSSLKIPQQAKIITYLGSIGGWYMVKEMFSFFKLVQYRHPEYVMLFLTKDDGEKVKREAEQLSIPTDKIFVTYANRNSLPLFLSLSSCGIFFIRNTFSKIASSPTKHGELMGMGIPVICNDIGDTGSIIRETRTGMVINDFSEENLDKYAETILELEILDKKNIRSCAKKYFDLQSGVEKYLSVYYSVLNN